MKTLCLVPVLALIAVPTNASEVGWRLSEDGLGPLKIGVDASAAGQILNEPSPRAESPYVSDCFVVTNTPLRGISLTFISGALARIDVASDAVSTTEGTKVGDLAYRVRMIYGRRIASGPRAPSDAFEYDLNVRSKSAMSSLRFFIRAGEVTMIAAGTKRAFEFDGPCS